MGGIVTLIWHWNAPKAPVNYGAFPWWKGFYTEATMFDLDKALNGHDPEGYTLLLRDLDAIAEKLKLLAQVDIPVLWRPLHPVHLNPVIRQAAEAAFDGNDRIRLIEPLDVLDFHNFMARAYMLLTDSSGVQEEVPSLSILP